MTLSTPTKNFAVRKGAIKDAATKLKESKKESKLIMDATMQIWGSVVQYEQLQQLNTQLEEEEVKLARMRTSLREMPPFMQVTKEAELKELQ